MQFTIHLHAIHNKARNDELIAQFVIRNVMVSVRLTVS